MVLIACRAPIPILGRRLRRSHRFCATRLLPRAIAKLALRNQELPRDEIRNLHFPAHAQLKNRERTGKGFNGNVLGIGEIEPLLLSL